ncbi:uncharacterized protein LOC6537624 isoform X4 [Drosophila yakuba]|uniref:uncharacterized protein LOC6537624 isoform X4 n=1 Tax=Drosophila yakuba TaxID=7245 RepID=UPI0019307738|nr:uncharacterized protein LOC6537624 isoform X4 [Drosophila yakuba]
MRSWKSRSRSKMQTLETRTRLLQGAQLTQLLLGAILCLTIASHTQTSAEAAGGRASGPGADRTSQGAGTSSASASASAASMAISSDESGDPSSATAFSSLAQVSSLLPEASALSATSGLVEPYLDGYATSNVTTQIGTHAYLPCRGRLHSRPAIPGHQAAGQVLDPADQVRPGPGRRLLRVPGLHGAQSQRPCPAASCGISRPNEQCKCQSRASEDVLSPVIDMKFPGCGSGSHYLSGRHNNNCIAWGYDTEISANIFWPRLLGFGFAFEFGFRSRFYL